MKKKLNIAVIFLSLALVGAIFAIYVHQESGDLEGLRKVRDTGPVYYKNCSGWNDNGELPEEISLSIRSSLNNNTVQTKYLAVAAAPVYVFKVDGESYEYHGTLLYNYKNKYCYYAENEFLKYLWTRMGDWQRVGIAKIAVEYKGSRP